VRGGRQPAALSQKEAEIRMARTHGHGNPDWTPDEIVLVLDLYFDARGQIPAESDKRVQDLSSLLRRVPYHALAARRESFRNPAGVAFKLQNLRQVATGEGLPNTSKADRQVWAELGDDPKRTKQRANLIRAAISASEVGPEDFAEQEFIEGRTLTELHVRRERSPLLRQRLLAARRRKGPLRCEMCSIGPYSSELEDAIFEAHHILSLSSSGERVTRLKDMALLCANCHRLLHRAITMQKRWLSVDEAREICCVGGKKAK
jgi:5-methylcytosine-specific restriction protein A